MSATCTGKSITMLRLPSCGRTLSAAFLLAVTPALAIWPIPEKISTGDQTLWINNDVRVTYNGQQVRRTPLLEISAPS